MDLENECVCLMKRNRAHSGYLVMVWMQPMKKKSIPRSLQNTKRHTTRVALVILLDPWETLREVERTGLKG